MPRDAEGEATAIRLCEEAEFRVQGAGGGGRGSGVRRVPTEGQLRFESVKPVGAWVRRMECRWREARNAEEDEEKARKRKAGSATLDGNCNDK